MQAVQAGQITFEDYFMASLNVAPLKIVGWEGVLGTGFMIVVLQPLVSLLPGKDGGGVHEDPIDSLHVRGHTSGPSAFACGMPPEGVTDPLTEKLLGMP